VYTTRSRCNSQTYFIAPNSSTCSPCPANLTHQYTLSSNLRSPTPARTTKSHLRAFCLPSHQRWFLHGDLPHRHSRAGTTPYLQTHLHRSNRTFVRREPVHSRRAQFRSKKLSFDEAKTHVTDSRLRLQNYVRSRECSPSAPLAESAWAAQILPSLDLAQALAWPGFCA
jgi:hypothetical protein